MPASEDAHVKLLIPRRCCYVRREEIYTALFVHVHLGDMQHQKAEHSRLIGTESSLAQKILEG